MIRRQVLAGEVEPTDVGLVAAHGVRNGAGTKFILRKGDVLGAEHLDLLRALGDRELHLVGVEADELHEAEAGARLARAVSGPGIDLEGPPRASTHCWRGSAACCGWTPSGCCR